MRKRWHFDPLPFAGVWWFGGMAAFAVCAICAPDEQVMSTAEVIALAVWLTPIVTALAAIAIASAVIALRDAWPRRVVEPVTDDLRSVERPS